MAPASLVLTPQFSRHGLLGRREDSRADVCTRYVLRTSAPRSIHPALTAQNIFFGRSRCALRMPELARKLPPTLHAALQRLSRRVSGLHQFAPRLIRADHSNQLDDAMPWPGLPGQKVATSAPMSFRRDHGRFSGLSIISRPVAFHLGRLAKP